MKSEKFQIGSRIECLTGINKGKFGIVFDIKPEKEKPYKITFVYSDGCYNDKQIIPNLSKNMLLDKEKVLERIAMHEKTVLKYTLQSEELEQCDKKDEVFVKFKNKLKNIHERLIIRLEVATETEQHEINNYFTKSKYLSSEILAIGNYTCRDEEYRQLIATLSGGNANGFTRRNCKKLKIQNPFVRAYDAFKQRHRSCPYWQTIRKKAKNEKGRFCSICKSTEKLDVHHNDGDRFNNDMSNLIVLCEPCHIRIHKCILEDKRSGI